jgi:hypothetical protein
MDHIQLNPDLLANIILKHGTKTYIVFNNMQCGQSPTNL